MGNCTLAYIAHSLIKHVKPDTVMIYQNCSQQTVQIIIIFYFWYACFQLGSLMLSSCCHSKTIAMLKYYEIDSQN